MTAGVDPSRFEQLPAGRIWYGAFDSADRLIGTIADVTHSQWWGGRLLTAADVAAVAVVPEARGKGAARAMLAALLEGAYERGAAVSALYPTASAVYRASGWAPAGQLRTVDLPTAALTGAGAPSGRLDVRAATPGSADLGAVRELYSRLAKTRDGLLSRKGAPYPAAAATTHDAVAEQWPPGIDGISLVEDEGELVGYASWSRGTGYAADALLDVPDLLATTPDAARELLGVLAGWRTVTPTIRLRPLDFDAASALVPWEAATRLEAKPWMHRPVDVSRAVADRGWPASRRGRVAFHLHDPVASWNDGGWTLDVADGAAQLVRTATQADLRLHIAGFALLYCGVATPAMLVESGLLHGPADEIASLELLRPASAAQLLDYF